MTAPRLAGMTVVSFESRFAKTVADLVSVQGGRTLQAPSMKEVPLSENRPALAFGERLLKGDIHALVLLTGVGTKALLSVLETVHPRADVLAAFARIPLVARGPKPVRVLAEWGLQSAVMVPEPNTWKEIVATLDAAKETLPLQGRTVAVQEYGVENPELAAALEERGASVVRVPVYRWALPDDTRPLEEAVRAIAEGRVHAAVFTTSVQIVHALEIARRLGLEEAFRAGLARTVVGSVGPDCSKTLRETGVRVDVEPESPKMGPLVLALAENGPRILAALQKGTP